MTASIPFGKSFSTAVLCLFLICCLTGCEGLGGNADEVAENQNAAEPGGADAEGEGGGGEEPTLEEQEETLEWMMNRLRDARDAGGDTIDGTSQWASDTFQRLKDNGLTTAENASDWVTQDFNNMWAWEYRVVSGADTDPESMEAQLNELGQSGWECFHVQPDSAGAPVFYFKKHKRSYLKSIPMRDLLRLLPAGGGEGGE